MVAVLGITLPSRASLGGLADSVEADRVALSGTRRPSVNRGRYAVQEMEVGATRVREYVSPSGEIFAMAWDGLAHPDLGTLLGAYASEWRLADRQAVRVPGRRTGSITTPNMVVERWGRMRDLHGRAYLPALLPEGVQVDEIQ